MALEKLSTTADLSWARKGSSAVPVRDRRGRLYTCSKNGVSVVTSDNNGKDWTSREVLDKSHPGTQTIKDGVSWITDINGEFRILRNSAEIRAAGFGGDRCAEVVMSGDMPHVLAHDGIYWSENRGQNWRGNYHFLGHQWVIAPLGLRLFADGKATLYTNRHVENRFRMHRSNDHGATWEKLLFGLTEGDFGDMVILRVHKDVLYFVAQARHSRRMTLYKSRAETAARLLEFEPAASLELFDIGPKGQLAVAGSQELFTSTNDGKTWTTINRGTLMKGSWIVQRGDGSDVQVP